MNQLQDLPSRAQLSGGYWSSLPIRVLQPGELRGWKPGRRHLRSAARSVLVEPRYRLERYGRRGFSVVGPHLWNLLPLDVRNYEIGLDIFKKKLKTFYAAVTNSASEVSKHQRRFTSVQYYYYYYY